MQTRNTPPPPPQDSFGGFRGATSTVLVVEDDPSCAEGLRQFLLSARVDPVVATTAEDAFVVLTQQSVALAIVDLVLPGLGGRELLGLMARNPALAQIPAIVISATQVALPHGAVAFLRKPIQPGELFDIVARYVPVRRLSLV